MAVPRKKHSKARSKKRRSQWKMKSSTSVTTCSETGATHQRHRAYEVDGVLYFKGKVLTKNS